MSLLKEAPANISEFTSSIAYKELEKLAKHPFDLTASNALTPERVQKYISQACGYKLLYGTERIDDQIMQQLIELAKERKVFEKMQQLQAGEKINFIKGFDSENRAVLHTALRDQFDNPRQDPAAKEARLMAKQQLDALKKFSEDIEKDPAIQNLIIVAIGGSELGPKACYNALMYLKKPNRKVYFISNVDPDAVAKTLKCVSLKNTIVAVVSKSGSTLEIATNELLLRDAYRQAGLDANQYFYAVTGQGSPLDNPKNYRGVFLLWDWVGGRYSSTSTVGGLPIVFSEGYDAFIEFLRGAHAMDQAALTPTLKTNLPLLAALLGIWNRNFLKSPTLAIIPYSVALSFFCDHLQQLDMESNGKRVDQNGNFVEFDTGPIIWGRPGTDAQHSFFQLLHQGTSRIPIEFIGFLEGQYKHDLELEGTTSQQKLLANLLAQSISLAKGQKSKNPNKDFPGNSPNHVLIAKQLTPYQLGALLSYHENKVVFQGFIWGINSFDQEGVQLGKVMSKQLIDQQKKGSGPVADLAGIAMLNEFKGL
ncbi:MAG: glucose-6-phosphate isomerase [Parachlamydiales bacterium]|jgi:glucose-6-phosphate isomerase